MATTFNDLKLKNLQQKQDSYQSYLDNSPTAYGGDTPPTSKDVSTDLALTKLRDTMRQIQSDQRKKMWAGDTVTTGADQQDEPLQKKGFIGKTLDVLQKPLWASTALVESALGKGVKKDVFENIKENMKIGHRTYGDVLEEVGAPRWISAPLGFAADVILDPVNILSMGSASLVGKMAKGAIRGESLLGKAEAFGKAFTSKAGQDILGAVKFGSKILPKSVKESALYKGGLESFSKGVARHAEDFNKLTGTTDELANLGKGIFGQPKGFLGEGVQSFIETYIPGGTDFIDKLKYDPHKYMQLVKMKDKVIGIMRGKEGSISSVGMEGADITKGIPDITKRDFGKPINIKQNYSKEQAAIWQRINEGVEDGIHIAENGGNPTSAIHAQGSLDWEERMAIEAKDNATAKEDVRKFADIFKKQTGETFYDEMAHQEINDAFKGFSIRDIKDDKKVNDLLAEVTKIKNRLSDEEFKKVMYAEGSKAGFSEAELKKFINKTIDKNKTGIEWYDNLRTSAGKTIGSWKVGEVAVGKKLLTAMENATSLFKWAKVPANIASHTNAVVGNVVMDHMAGWDVAKTVPWVKKAYGFMRGKSSAEFMAKNFFFEGSKFSEWAAQNPTVFEATFGFDPSMVGGKYFTDFMIKRALEKGWVKPENTKQLLEEIAKMSDEVRQALEGKKAALAGVKGPAIQNLERWAERGGETKLATPTSAIRKNPEMAGRVSSSATELGLGDAPYMDFISKKAETSVAYKTLRSIIDTSTSVFESHDQASKLGKALYATKEGVTLGELKKLSRMIPNGITDKDILETVVDPLLGGAKRYKLSWDVASDLVNETNMNYAAMPAFVRMMRSMPILGAPFVSFTYAAIPKGIKTLYHNPGAFNKINFLISELSGNKTPAEKKNLESKYSAWFNTPNMLRLGTWNDKKPAYLNLTNMLPYYSLSLWNSSNRSYKDTLPNSFIQTIDKLQLMKTPGGQMLVDYIITPLLLSEKESPIGSFGQQLYPKDATGWTKAGYAAKSVAESYVPSSAGLLGMFGARLPENVIEASPSYIFKKMARAGKGESPIGVIKKNSTPGELRFKGLMGAVGLPINTMDTSFVTNNPKKKKKK